MISSLYPRYRWIRFSLVGLVLYTICILLKYIITYQKNPTPLVGLLNAENYPQYLKKFRKKYMNHIGDNVYLDYTGAGVYSDLDIERFRRDVLFSDDYRMNESDKIESELVEDTRNKILEFLGAKNDDYIVVFVASATQALKLIGENYNWSNNSKFIYTRYNHNSVLGMRKYALKYGANFSVVNSSKEMVSDKDALYAVALEDNFAGTKIGKDEMYRLTHTDGMTVIGDSSAFLPSNKLNLTEYPFDAIVLSFYKIFGFPNYGACILRKDFAQKFVKKTYLEGSIEITLPSYPNEYILKKELPYKLEDDYPSPEMVRGAAYGIESTSIIGIENIEKYVWSLTQRLYNGLKSLKHSNNLNVVEIYGNHNLNDGDLQGGIVAFNIQDSNGKYVGYATVIKEASKAKFHLRGGCHCNPGACFESMGISEDRVKAYYDRKTTCGDNNDIIDDIPLGSVRASLGWASTEEDVDSFIDWISKQYKY